VVAKNDRAHQGLSAQFADHGRSGPLQRSYLAFVWGAVRPHGTVETGIDRSTRNREKIEIKRSGGREALTHYRVEERFGAKGQPAVASLIKCQLETGRTHQIRVHLASIGHPLIGDRAYGSGFATKVSLIAEPARTVVAAFPRQALHAFLLAFEHPATGEEMHFESAPPADMFDLLTALKSL